MKEIKIPIKLVDQNKATLKLDQDNKESNEIDKNWARKSCAICSLKMVLSLYNKNTKDIPVMTLVNEGLSIDGFIEGIGWKHGAIIKLARNHGIKMYRMFCRKPSYRKNGLNVLNFNLINESPIMASIYYNLDKSKGGHVIVVNGCKIDSKNRIIGYYITDPDGINKKGNKYYLTRDEFNNNWRGGLLYFKKP